MTENKDISRREFFSYGFMGSSLLASMALLSYYVIQFLLPAPNKNPTRKIFITTTDKISPGKSFKFKDLKGSEITVTHTGKEYIALSKVHSFRVSGALEKGRQGFLLPLPRRFF